MYGLVNCYRSLGEDKYDWHAFGPNLDEVAWDYLSFTPTEPQSASKGYRKVAYPAGSKDWVKPTFDPTKAGWKQGLQPFGQLDGQRAPLSETCSATFCRCGETPKTLWRDEVLLVRAEIELPPMKPNHRYRIVLGGASHVNSGEGFAIYVNGRLLAESKSGVAVRQGGQPRGAYVYDDFRKEFESGKATIAATSFLRYNHPRIKPYPPRGHLTIQIEEQRLPPLAAELAE